MGTLSYAIQGGDQDVGHSTQKERSSSKSETRQIKPKQERSTDAPMGSKSYQRNLARTAARANARIAASEVRAARKAVKQMEKAQMQAAAADMVTTLTLLPQAASSSKKTRKSKNASRVSSVAVAQHVALQQASQPDNNVDSGLDIVDGVFGMSRKPSACNQGKISQIKCWLDADGYITGLAFESEAGITAPALCRVKGQVTDGGALDLGESIVEIMSCR